MNALKQIKIDTAYIKKSWLCKNKSEVDRAFKDVCDKVCKEWIIFSMASWLALTVALCIYVFWTELFFRCFALVWLPAVCINTVYLRVLYRERKAVIQSAFRIEWDKVKLVLQFKDGTEKDFTGDFDFWLNGSELIIVRDSDDVFSVFESSSIESLIIMKPPHEAKYHYDCCKWEEV